MVQKMNIKEMYLTICGTGRIDETRPIDLAAYTIGYSPTRNEPVPVIAIPGKIQFSQNIAGTAYDVTGSFDLDGKQTLLQQLKDLLMKQSMEDPRTIE